MARTLLGEPLVFYRTESGKAWRSKRPLAVTANNAALLWQTASGDEPALRLSRLESSMPRGRCIEDSGAERKIARCASQSLPLIEKWIFSGSGWAKPAKRDESLLPSGMSRRHAADAERMSVRLAAARDECDWQLNNDNLLDLTHVIYVLARDAWWRGRRSQSPVTTSASPRSVRNDALEPQRRAAAVAGTARENTIRPNATLAGALCEIPSHCSRVQLRSARRQSAAMAIGNRGVRLRVLITATPRPGQRLSCSMQQFSQLRVLVTSGERRLHQERSRAVFLDDVAVIGRQQRTNNVAARRPTDRDPRRCPGRHQCAASCASL